MRRRRRTILVWILCMFLINAGCLGVDENQNETVPGTEATISEIVLSDDGIRADGQGATVNGNTVTISEAGNYTLSGSVSEGQVIVALERRSGEENVNITLNNVDITCSEGPALWIQQAGAVVITLAEESNNSLSGSNVKASDSGDTSKAALYSTSDLTVDGTGSLVLSSKYKGIHGDRQLMIESGTIEILQCKEGIEAAVIQMQGGAVTVTASDDGMNASSSQMDERLCRIEINGGILQIAAKGDGIDSNGDLVMTGGEVYVDGPVKNKNAAVDYSGTARLSGGILIAVGSMGESQNFGRAENQCVWRLHAASVQPAGSELMVKNSEGEVVLSYCPAKEYQSILISSPELIPGNTYTISVNGTELMTAELTDWVTDSIQQ